MKSEPIVSRILSNFISVFLQRVLLKTYDIY